MVNYTKYADIEIFEGKISKHQYPWHFHHCYTLIIVEEGSILYEFQDMILKVEKGEALIIEPGKIHRNTISHPAAYRAYFLPCHYFETATQNVPGTRRVNQSDIVDQLVCFLNKIELNTSKSKLQEIVFRLCQLIDDPQQEKHSGVNKVPKINHELTIKELAEKAHLSKFHFQRKFKKNYGLTIGQLKQQEKTVLAKTLLENGKLSTEVAYELGFFDQSHFIKYFRKMWAITPKHLKKAQFFTIPCFPFFSIL